MIILRKLTLLFLAHKALCLIRPNSDDETTSVQKIAGKLLRCLRFVSFKSDDADQKGIPLLSENRPAKVIVSTRLRRI